MKALTLIVILFLLTALLKEVFGQQFSQLIRGTVTDKDSGMPLFGASLVIEGTDPQVGTTSDKKGNFKFSQLAVGRHTILVFYMGYESRSFPNLNIIAGKELVLQIELTESVIKLDEVVISEKKSKSETLNEMTSVSARTFTVEETRRYAGSVNDPARMASAFAGVASDPGGNNEIIVRGNSPRGMLWRLEGVEIPNPNHFAEEGSTGGPISILNSATLGNSDFFTGAFPAEYGNAYSGVFDIALRSGNNQKREYTLQAGALGIDCTLEGPFKLGKPASYLVNYRYSTLALLNAVGVHIAGDAVPKFQDLTFKVNIPTADFGLFSIFGLAGSSNIHEEENTFWNDFQTDMVATGIKHTYFIDPKTYIKSYIAFTGSRNIWTYKEPDEFNNFYVDGRENFIYNTTKFSTSVNRKFNAKNVLKAGVVFNYMQYDLFTDYFDQEEQRLVKEVDQKGTTTMLQSYATWKHRFTEKWTFVSGIHSMYFYLNNNYTVEPRLGIRWQFAEDQTLTGGIGFHSRMESLTTYFAEIEDESGNVSIPNKDLDFTKAIHFVAGYEILISEFLFLKLEGYFQHLYNVPVEDSISSSFSAVNYSWGYATRKLNNTGKGGNVGIEVTLEKYFSKNYYFLFTSSIYDSKYTGSDGVERNTRYNGNFGFNLLAGKDFVLGKNDKKRIFSISFRGSWAGGQRTTPIDLYSSEIEGSTERYEDQAFSDQWDDYMRYDIKFSLSRNRKKTTHTIELDIQNFSNRLNVIGDYYDSEQNEVSTYTQTGLIPILNYRLEF